MPRRGENIFKRKDGRWEARYIHHYEGGRAKYRYIYGKTYTEAKLRRMDALSEKSWGADVEHKRLATVEQVAWAWLREVKLSVKESTYTRYYRILTNTVLPKFGKKPVCMLQAREINDFSMELLNRGGKRNQPLAPKTVADILCVVKSIWKFGITNGYPFSSMEGIRYPQQKRKNLLLFNDLERELLESICLSSEDLTGLGILFAASLGLRIGEVCGLQWADIDFEAAFIKISRTVERISDLDSGAERKTKVILSEPKTKTSYRTIPIPDFLLRHAKKFRSKSTHYLLSGSERFLEPHAFYMKYKRFLKRYGISDHTFHALRHTFATRCVEYGFDTKSLAEILGHSSVSTTLTFYVHPSMESKRIQLERLTPTCLSQSKL